MIQGTFRSYFGAICVPIVDKGNGTISNVTHDWASAKSSLGGGLAVTMLNLQIRNYRVDLAKEKLAEMALANNVDFLFFLDDDVLCPPDTLLKMVKLWQSDPKYSVISGVYWSKSDPAVPLVFKGNLQGSYWDWKTTDLIQADAAGAGCLFISADVLRKMPKPWFSCEYSFEDPRSSLDLQLWNLDDQLGNELRKGKHANDVIIKKITDDMKKLSDEMEELKTKAIPPELLRQVKADAQTTEDLYFFKKIKEMNVPLWIDCSIQCGHQDKATGRIFGLMPDAPQVEPRFDGIVKRGEKIIVDIGAGQAQYFIKEGTPIRVDLDPATKPDVIADARFLHMFPDCFADMVFSSHTLEHISFHETISVLKEWARIVKVGGELVIVVPNLKWAAKRVLNDVQDIEEAKRAIYMHYSAQKGNLREAYTDVHRAGFTVDSLRGALSRIDGLTDIKVVSSEGNIGNWDRPENLREDGFGYNLIAIAKKTKHNNAISLKTSFDQQQQGMYQQESPKEKNEEKKTEKSIIKQMRELISKK